MSHQNNRRVVLEKVDDLVSIIILAHNHLEHTKLALESLLDNTSQVKTPYEVIVVDNASTDGTGAYLKSLEEKGEIRVLSNIENQGFPKANNQAAKIANGKYLCLCNNDVVFTPEWLEKLLRCIRSDHKLAAVGPMTSHASGRQKAAVGHTYTTRQDLDKFASSFSCAEKEVDMLVFFCCLIKRQVWDLIGGLDEDLGRGNYDDDEFCYLAMQAGYKLKVCSAYVYHFGGVSFGYNRSDKENQEYMHLLARNQKIFLRNVKQYKKVSLCMIVADYENPANFKRCLDSVSEWVDEVNIVFNYKLFPNYVRRRGLVNSIPSEARGILRSTYLKWTNFSDMRNKSLDMATGEYIFWLDADDVLTTPQGIRDLILRNPDIDYFKCRVNSYTESRNSIEIIFQNRLFKNKPEFRFRNLVHEDISFSMKEADAKHVMTNLTINHLGYTGLKAMFAKNVRNMKYLRQEMRQGTAHSLTYYAMANSLIILGKKLRGKRKTDNSLEVVRLIDEAFDKFKLKDEDPLTPKMWVLRGLACSEAHQVAAAKQSYHKAYDGFKHPEAAVLLADLYMQEKNWQRAIEILSPVYEMESVEITNIPYDRKGIEASMLSQLGDCYVALSNAIGDKPQKIVSPTTKKESDVTPSMMAFKFYSEALQVTPDDLVLLDKLCNVLFRAGRVDDAAFLTLKTINRFPGYANGYFNMGQYEMFHNRPVSAKLFWREAVRIRPNYPEAQHNLRALEAGGRRAHG